MTTRNDIESKHVSLTEGQVQAACHVQAAESLAEAPAAAVIGRLLERVGRMARGLQYACGLNPAQWDALRYLAQANRHSRTPSALAAYLGATKGTTSQTVSALEEKGLLRRLSESADRRSVQLELTKEGSALLASDPLFDLEETIAALDPSAQSGLVVALEELLRALAARRSVAQFGVCQRCGHLQGECGSGSAHCGLLGEALSPADTGLLCVDFVAGAPARKPD